MEAIRRTSQYGAKVVRAWFGLTKDERQALLLVLSLFLLGVGVRFWHVLKNPPPASAPPGAEAK
jgi:hypothetical protein